jgi:hypothetical protein
MIIAELTAGVRILLEKGLSRYNISEDQQFSKKYPEDPILPEDGGGPPGAHTTPRRGPGLAARPGGVAALVHLC